VLLLITGSFFVYCAEDVIGGLDGGLGRDGGALSSDGQHRDGMVGRADAQSSAGGTCCTPPDPPPATVVFDQVFTPSYDRTDGCVTPAWDVSGFRTVVVHVDCSTFNSVQWRWGMAGFHGQSVSCTGAGDGILMLDPRLGHDLRITLSSTSSGFPLTTTCATNKITVMGFRS
jgi:hypothetical protein